MGKHGDMWGMVFMVAWREIVGYAEAVEQGGMAL